MNIDLNKYLKNKDVKFKSEDFDMEALTNDFKSEATKGFISEKDHTNKISEALKSKETEFTTKYGELESNYNNTVKQLGDTNGKLKTVSLEKTMISKGFKEDKFEEVSKLRESLFADEKDDNKAIELVAERFKGTYFAESTPTTPTVPNENSLHGGQGTAPANNSGMITKDTPLSQMIAK